MEADVYALPPCRCDNLRSYQILCTISASLATPRVVSIGSSLAFPCLITQASLCKVAAPPHRRSFAVARNRTHGPLSPQVPRFWTEDSLVSEPLHYFPTGEKNSMK